MELQQRELMVRRGDRLRSRAAFRSRLIPQRRARTASVTTFRAQRSVSPWEVSFLVEIHDLGGRKVETGALDDLGLDRGVDEVLILAKSVDVTSIIRQPLALRKGNIASDEGCRGEAGFEERLRVAVECNSDPMGSNDANAR